MIEKLNKFIEDHIVMDELDGVERTKVEFNFNDWIRFKRENFDKGEEIEMTTPDYPKTITTEKVDHRTYPVPGAKKPGVKVHKKITRAKFRYPSGLRNFCINRIDKMKNPELMAAANEEFDLDMDYTRLMSFLVYNNIKRSKKIPKEQPKEKYHKESEEGNKYQVGIKHFSEDGDYLCNSSVNASKEKLTDDWDEVTCNNCKAKKGEDTFGEKIDDLDLDN